MEQLKSFIAQFAPYLEDMRRRLYFTAVVFAIFFAGGFFATGAILKRVLAVFDLENVAIATTSPFQFADLSLNIGFLVALVATSPILIYNLFAFLRPAMSKRERRVFLIMIPISTLLFAVGFLYGFFVLYYALVLLAKVNVSIGIQNIWDIGMFLTQIVLTAGFLGMLFQFPLVMTALIRMGLADAGLLRRKRRVAAFIIFIFTTLLPPTDGLSLMAMALPLIVLYELTILVNSRMRAVTARAGEVAA